MRANRLDGRGKGGEGGGIRRDINKKKKRFFLKINRKCAKTLY